MRIYDYAPRLALRAKARRRRNLIGTALLLALPALSFHAAPQRSNPTTMTAELAQR